VDECAKMVASAIMSDVNVCIDWCVLIRYGILSDLQAQDGRVLAMALANRRRGARRHPTRRTNAEKRGSL
jgi:hypothetical protein